MVGRTTGIDEMLSGSGRGPYGILSMPTEIDRIAVVINQIPNGIAAILSGDPAIPRGVRAIRVGSVRSRMEPKAVPNGTDAIPNRINAIPNGTDPIPKGINTIPEARYPAPFRDIKRDRGMHSSLQKFQGWRARRELLSLQRWGQERAKGEARFVFKTALTYSLTVGGVTHVYHSLIHGHAPISVPNLVLYLLVALLAASSRWSIKEDKYFAALNEARIQAPVRSEPPPHNNPGA